MTRPAASFFIDNDIMINVQIISHIEMEKNPDSSISSTVKIYYKKYSDIMGKGTDVHVVKSYCSSMLSFYEQYFV
jgi:hypothetical protein